MSSGTIEKPDLDDLTPNLDDDMCWVHQEYPEVCNGEDPVAWVWNLMCGNCAKIHERRFCDRCHRFVRFEDAVVLTKERIR